MNATFEGQKIDWEGSGLYVCLKIAGYWTWTKVTSLEWLENKMATSNVIPSYLVEEDLDD